MKTAQIRMCYCEKDGKEVKWETTIKGKWHENKKFKYPDQNGNLNSLQDWDKKCFDLNQKYEKLHHWVERK